MNSKIYIGIEEQLKLGYSVQVIAGRPVYEKIFGTLDEAIAHTERAPEDAAVQRWDRVNISQVCYRGEASWEHIECRARLFGVEPCC